MHYESKQKWLQEFNGLIGLYHTGRRRPYRGGRNHRSIELCEFYLDWDRDQKEGTCHAGGDWHDEKAVGADAYAGRIVLRGTYDFGFAGGRVPVLADLGEEPGRGNMVHGISFHSVAYAAGIPDFDHFRGADPLPCLSAAAQGQPGRRDSKK